MKFGIKPPPFGSSQIAEMAEALSKEYVETVGITMVCKRGITFSDVYEQLIYPKFEIALDEAEDLGFDELGAKILGLYDPLDNRAFVDRSLTDDPRRVFTLWHEVAGHGVLQGKWLRQQLDGVASTQIVTTDQSLSPHTINVLERQANCFAANAAAPGWYLDAIIKWMFRPTKPFIFVGPCGYWLEVNGVKSKHNVTDVDDLCRLIASKIRHYFGGISKESLGYRIKESGWIAHQGRPRIQLRRTGKITANAQGQVSVP